jgi:hypothetical protein
MKIKIFSIFFLLILSVTTFAGSGMDSFWLKPLSNDLIAFSAVINGDQVDIEWVTDTEISIDYFIIMRSDDSINFEDIATVGALGKSKGVLRYSIIDFRPLSGISYYKLKQINIDGDFKFSEVIAVEFEVDQESLEATPVVLVSPNPVPSSGNMNILLSNFKENEVVNVVLHNQSGIECSANMLSTDPEGNVVFNFSCADLSPGLYLISAQSNTAKVNTMIVISSK